MFKHGLWKSVRGGFKESYRWLLFVQNRFQKMKPVRAAAVALKGQGV